MWHIDKNILSLCHERKEHKNINVMKAEDLNIGDVIKVAWQGKQPTIEKVYALESVGVFIKVHNEAKMITYDKVLPVSIAAEILLKSNFKKATTYDEGEFYHSKEDSEYYYNIRMCYRPTKNQWNIHTERFNVGENSKYFLREFDGCIKYVHELQHVLKVVGIEKEVIV